MDGKWMENGWKLQNRIRMNPTKFPKESDIERSGKVVFSSHPQPHLEVAKHHPAAT
jgi:hypothetical protein